MDLTVAFVASVLFVQSESSCHMSTVNCSPSQWSHTFKFSMYSTAFGFKCMLTPLLKFKSNAHRLQAQVWNVSPHMLQRSKVHFAPHQLRETFNMSTVFFWQLIKKAELSMRNKHLTLLWKTFDTSFHKTFAKSKHLPAKLIRIKWIFVQLLIQFCSPKKNFCDNAATNLDPLSAFVAKKRKDDNLKYQIPHSHFASMMYSS